MLYDQQKGAFVAAFRLEDGTEAWRAERGVILGGAEPGGRRLVVLVQHSQASEEASGFREQGRYVAPAMPGQECELLGGRPPRSSTKHT